MKPVYVYSTQQHPRGTKPCQWMYRTYFQNPTIARNTHGLVLWDAENIAANALYRGENVAEASADVYFQIRCIRAMFPRCKLGVYDLPPTNTTTDERHTDMHRRYCEVVAAVDYLCPLGYIYSIDSHLAECANIGSACKSAKQFNKPVMPIITGTVGGTSDGQKLSDSDQYNLASCCKPYADGWIIWDGHGVCDLQRMVDNLRRSE